MAGSFSLGISFPGPFGGRRAASPYGPNLVVNGDGSSTVGWSHTNGALTSTAGWLRNTITGTPGIIGQGIAVESGATYAFWGKIRTSTGTARLVIGTTLGGVDIFAGAANTNYEAQEVVVSAAMIYVSARTLTGISAGAYFEIDDIILRKVL